MSNHHFVCGQPVMFVDKRFLGPSWSGAFIVIKQLPSGEGAPRYQIKSTGEAYSRMAYEHQLSAVFEILR